MDTNMSKPESPSGNRKHASKIPKELPQLPQCQELTNKKPLAITKVPLEIQLSISELTLGCSLVIKENSATSPYQERLRDSENLLLVFPELEFVENIIKSPLFGLYNRIQAIDYHLDKGDGTRKTYWKQLMEESEHRRNLRTLRIHFYNNFNMDPNDPTGLRSMLQDFRRLEKVEIFFPFYVNKAAIEEAYTNLEREFKKRLELKRRMQHGRLDIAEWSFPTFIIHRQGYKSTVCRVRPARYFGRHRHLFEQDELR